MPKVVYFKNGKVADFAVEQADYESFTEQLSSAPSPNDATLLEQSRQLLEACLERGEGFAETELGAACFVLSYFNNNEDAETAIEGDIIIIDESGQSQRITYAALADVNLQQTH